MKKKIILLILVIALVVAGCNQEPIAFQKYHTGKTGLQLSFLENLPKDTVYENGEIFVSLRLANTGAYSLNSTKDLKNTKIKIYHSSPFLLPQESFETTLEKLQSELHGKWLEYPRGDFMYITGTKYDVQSIQILAGTSQVQKAAMHASVCYPYLTEMTQDVCIETDIYDTSNTALCKAKKSIEYSNGQGAPVSVTKIEPEMRPIPIQLKSNETNVLKFNEETGEFVQTTERVTQTYVVQPIYRIYVENVGNGKAKYPLGKDAPGSNEMPCDEGFSAKDSVKIHAKLGNTTLECVPEVLEIGEDNYVTCYPKEDTIHFINQNYHNLLNIDLSYYYKESIKKDIEINRLPTAQRRN